MNKIGSFFGWRDASGHAMVAKLLLITLRHVAELLNREGIVWAVAGGVDAFVLSCEDLIVFKLSAGRIIDLADAAALLRANRDLIDFSLLRHECAQYHLSDDLSRVWDEAFPDTNMPGQDA